MTHGKVTYIGEIGHNDEVIIFSKDPVGKW